MDKGLDFEQAKRMAARMGMGVMAQEEAAEYFIKMYKLFTEKVRSIEYKILIFMMTFRSFSYIIVHNYFWQCYF